MFCPECKAEYVDGITECADCHVPLVWMLPTEPEEEPGEPVKWAPLLTTTFEADIALVKSILDSEGIAYWVDGEHRSIIRRGNMGSVIYVDETRIKDAENLIRDLDLNAFGWSTRTTDELD